MIALFGKAVQKNLSLFFVGGPTHGLCCQTTPCVQSAGVAGILFGLFLCHVFLSCRVLEDAGCPKNFFIFFGVLTMYGDLCL